MPAKDIYHEKIKSALIKEDWTITHDPLRLTWGTKDMYVDLGAEQLLAAEKTGRRIAVEVKSFVGASEMDDLEKAIGQYIVYRSVMGKTEPDIFNAWQNCVFLCASRWEGVAPLTDDGGTTPFQRKAQVMRLLSIERYKYLDKITSLFFNYLLLVILRSAAKPVPSLRSRTSSKLAAGKNLMS